MRAVYPILLLFLFYLSTAAQDVNCTRTADLVRSQAYDITGQAFFERLDNNSLRLRLSDDFSTNRGPDVQVFLHTDSTHSNGAISLVDLGSSDGLNHFSGALTIDVPDNVDIDDYDYIVFHCFAFNAHWAHGTFDAKCDSTPDTTNMMGGDTTMMVECVTSIAATTAWETERTVCAVDGEADIIPLLNTQSIPAGDNYAYVFTDADKKIRFLHFEDEYDFEGSGQQTDFIYGVSYSGDLMYEEGDDLLSITASDCAIVSDTSLFLTVFKEDCEPPFECVFTNTATTNWVTERRICSSDGVADQIPLLNNQFIPAGENYGYIITDTLDRIRYVHYSDTLDFEGTGPEPDRIYGVSFDGVLTATEGEVLSSISATGCLTLSDSTLFLTVYKDSCAAMAFECVESIVSTIDEATSVDICESDGVSDVVTLVNSAGETPGANYAYLITDESNRIKFVHREVNYDFENSGSENYRVFGISHDGDLDAEVADHISEISSSSGCLVLSDTTTFLTIVKGQCAPDTSTMGNISISGLVLNVNGDPLEGITISAASGESATTDATGSYTISGIPSGSTITLIAEGNGPAAQGLSSTDIIVGQRHILGLARIEDPFNLAAADTNGNGSVTAADLVLIVNVLLGRTESFGDNTSWRFYEEETAAGSVSSEVILQTQDSDITGVNFIGVKTGDLNGSISN